MTKAEKIKQTLQQTKERRKNQIPVVYQLKINLNSVPKETKNKLFSANFFMMTEMKMISSNSLVFQNQHRHRKGWIVFAKT